MTDEIVQPGTYSTLVVGEDRDSLLRIKLAIGDKV
jgi:hypothetical protein